MGLEKSIQYRKEKRKKYRDSREFDHSCRNHSSCPWCKSNRLIFDRRWREKSTLDNEIKSDILDDVKLNVDPDGKVVEMIRRDKEYQEKTKNISIGEY